MRKARVKIRPAGMTRVPPSTDRDTTRHPGSKGPAREAQGQAEEVVMKRAIAIRRVSQRNGREGESFSSPQDQRDKIAKFAEGKDWQMDYPTAEVGVSGNALLEDRPQLSRAVMAVQAGTAQVIVASDTSRLWWSHETAALVKRLVEDAGGEIWTVDAGRLSDESPTDELNGTMHTAVDRFSRRQNRNKSWDAVQRAIDRGVAPWDKVTPGYLKRENGTYEPDPQTKDVVAKAFKLRAYHSATVKEVRAYLAANGIHRTYPATVALLRSRVVLGELHFGNHTPNLKAWKPIVKRKMWNDAQDVRLPRGPKPKSEMLLARVGVLRCGTCGARMCVDRANNGKGRYRCPPTVDCDGRVTINGEVAETVVVAAVRQALDGWVGSRAARRNVRQARVALEEAKADLSTALRRVLDFQDDEAAQELLTELRDVRDRAQERVDQLGPVTDHDELLALAHDWDRLSIEDKRRCIPAAIRAAIVHKAAPGRRGADRIEIIGWGLDWDAYPELPKDLS